MLSYCVSNSNLCRVIFYIVFVICFIETDFVIADSPSTRFKQEATYVYVLPLTLKEKTISYENNAVLVSSLFEEFSTKRNLISSELLPFYKALQTYLLPIPLKKGSNYLLKTTLSKALQQLRIPSNCDVHLIGNGIKVYYDPNLKPDSAPKKSIFSTTPNHKKAVFNQDASINKDNTSSKIPQITYILSKKYAKQTIIKQGTPIKIQYSSGKTTIQGSGILVKNIRITSERLIKIKIKTNYSNKSIIDHVIIGVNFIFL